LQNRTDTFWVFHAFLSKGYIAVQIFFALSGFLIFHSFSKILSGNGKRPVVQFFIKRFFRIFPAWFVALIIYSIHKHQYDIGIFFSDFFFIFALRPFRFEELTALHAWSIYIEEVFYLSFPLFIYFFRHHLILPLLLVALTLKMLFSNFYTIPSGHVFFTPFDCFSFFIWGIICYLALPYLRKVKSSDILFGFCLAIVSAVSICTQKGEQLIEPFIAVWFLYIVAGPPLFTKVFNFIFARLGRLCFSIYLMHLVCIWNAQAVSSVLSFRYSLNESVRLPLSFGIALLLTLFSANLLYRFVELPFINLGRRLSHLSKCPDGKASPQGSFFIS
jgi:peptidoglycan/LPS O-acetylase OafA/YrhL